MNKLPIPIALIGMLVMGIFGWGETHQKLVNQAEKIEKVENKQEKTDEYVMEQREINVEQKVRMEAIQEILERIEKKLE